MEPGKPEGWIEERWMYGWIDGWNPLMNALEQHWEHEIMSGLTSTFSYNISPYLSRSGRQIS